MNTLKGCLQQLSAAEGTVLQPPLSTGLMACCANNSKPVIISKSLDIVLTSDVPDVRSVSRRQAASDYGRKGMNES